MIRRALIVTALGTLLAPSTALPQRVNPASRPVAIVTEVRGNASAAAPGVATRAVRALDWFADGTTLSTDSDASLIVVFASGGRARLGPRSQFRVTSSGPSASKGTVQTLPPVPPLPQVSAVPLDGPATRINAVRVRGDGFAVLHPDEAAVLPDSARLEFETDREFSSYTISIEREDGSIAFETTTKAMQIEVRPGVLTPGAQYHWHVQAQDSLGRRVRGSARFVTLTNEQIARRLALKQHFGTSPDDSAFLAEIDRSLGLLR